MKDIELCHYFRTETGMVGECGRITSKEEFDRMVWWLERCPKCSKYPSGVSVCGMEKCDVDKALIELAADAAGDIE